jgi:hypothetical protein
MGADEFDLNRLEPVDDADDQPKFVAADVKNHAIVGDEIDSCSKLAFDVGRCSPISA